MPSAFVQFSGSPAATDTSMLQPAWSEDGSVGQHAASRQHEVSPVVLLGAVVSQVPPAEGHTDLPWLAMAAP